MFTGFLIGHIKIEKTGFCHSIYSYNQRSTKLKFVVGIHHMLYNFCYAIGSDTTTISNISVIVVKSCRHVNKGYLFVFVGCDIRCLANFMILLFNLFDS